MSKDHNVQHVETAKTTVSLAPVTTAKGYNASHQEVASGMAEGHGEKAQAEAIEQMHSDAAAHREADAKESGGKK